MTLDIVALAQERASIWCPEAGDVVVEQRSIHRKRFSTVYELALVGSSGDTRVFVKEPGDRSSADRPSRPHAIVEQPPGSKARLQADALADIHRAIGMAADPLLGAVRVLDCVEDRLLVMAAGDGEPLRELVLRHVRWHRRGRIDLDEVFSRAGRILGVFHAQVRRPDAPVALGHRDDVVLAIEKLSDYLADVAGAGKRVRSFGLRMAAQAERHLPTDLGVATRFGDFGLTNLLVTPNGKVTAIDTLAFLRTPPLHDATYFLTGLTAIRPQVLTRGHAIDPASIDAWQRSFWAGYLGDRPAPRGAISLWSGLRLLERWAAKTTRTAAPLLRHGPGALVDSFVGDLVEQSIVEAEAAEPRPDLVDALGLR